MRSDNIQIPFYKKKNDYVCFFYFHTYKNCSKESLTVIVKFLPSILSFINIPQMVVKKKVAKKAPAKKVVKKVAKKAPAKKAVAKKAPAKKVVAKKAPAKKAPAKKVAKKK